MISGDILIKFFELFTDWFAQIIALATGIILLMATLNEKLLTIPEEPIAKRLYRLSFYLAVLAAVVAILTSVIGQFQILAVLGVPDQAQATIDNQLGLTLRIAIIAFMVELSSLLAFAGLGTSFPDKQLTVQEKTNQD